MSHIANKFSKFEFSLNFQNFDFNLGKFKFSNTRVILLNCNGEEGREREFLLIGIVYDRALWIS